MASSFFIMPNFTYSFYYIYLLPHSGVAGLNVIDGPSKIINRPVTAPLSSPSSAASSKGTVPLQKKKIDKSSISNPADFKVSNLFLDGCDFLKK